MRRQRVVDGILQAFDQHVCRYGAGRCDVGVVYVRACVGLRSDTVVCSRCFGLRSDTVVCSRCVGVRE